MSRRIQRVNELIKRELSKIILDELDVEEGVLVTVTRVDTSVDLGAVKVYISIIPEENIKEIMDILQKNIWRFQKILDKKLKMRKVPRIMFREERKTREADRIERILESLKNKEND